MVSKVLLFFAAIHLYLWYRLVRRTELPAPWAQIAATFLFLAYISMPIGLELIFPLPLAVSRAQLWPIYFWMGTMLILGAILVCCEPIHLVVWAVSRFVPRSKAIITPRFRRWIARGLALSSVAVMAFCVSRAVPRALDDVPIKRVEVVLPKLSPALNGTTIVQLTDMHLGTTLDRCWLSNVVEQVNELKPDVVVITGDLVDYRTWKLKEDIAPLADLRPRLGTYFVTGNHEYYFHVDRWLPEIRRHGVRVLRNERVAITKDGASYDLAGIDDVEGSRHHKSHGADISRALAGRDTSRPVVLLAHRPNVVGEAAKHEVDLLLAGHTHGGQFWPWYYLLRTLYGGYVAGRYQVGPTQLYVSAGTGFWGPPMRLGTSNEITLITLRSK
jgi:uncharacterized protein